MRVCRQILVAICFSTLSACLIYGQSHPGQPKRNCNGH